MQKINVLDSSIFNRISAGEVVERPASVVKELVENSLDAKATNITIEIENGGTKLIRITDNGVGIYFDDLKKAFLPHATSKISSVDDLDSISTLGFRGEALASIASVSKVELFSKTNDSDVGGKILVEGGLFKEETEYGCANGTSIFVKDLFYNTPARLKFLKSNKQEESAITNIVNRLMFANPDISFKYIIDGKIIYNTVTKGLKDKIYTIYGKAFIENLIELNVKTDKYEVNGYISLPTFCKANKTYQTLIVNGRYIANSLISTAISNAYENFLMKGKFPIFILNFKLNYDDIDVNVHPSKMEVKFKNTREIFSLFYSSILEKLNEQNCSINYDLNDNAKNSFLLIEKSNNDENFIKPDSQLKKIEGGFSFSSFNNFNNELNNLNVEVPKYKNDEFSVLKSPDSLKPENSLDFEEKLKISNEHKKLAIVNMNQNLFEDASVKEFHKQEKFENDFTYKLIGSLFNTYIVIEREEEVYLIDQHAGHERLLFDKFMSQFNDNKLISQPLLIPYIFNVNEIENDLIENNIDVFNNFGFEIENFGNLTYKINSIPSILNGLNLESFIFDMLSNTTKISNTSEEIKNHFAKKACKAAVKGGQNLSKEEIDILLKEIFNKKTTLLCPHGRPICVKLTKYEIEKMFKRIV